MKVVIFCSFSFDFAKTQHYSTNGYIELTAVLPLRQHRNTACLFSKLPWPRDNDGIFRSSSQVATCLPVYHTQ